tara:strand:+ start:1212 stop:1376 length:165 start_codon:yes stop_codon:yes gene_type:complete
MKLQKKVDLLQLFPQIEKFEFESLKFGNEKIYIAWINDKNHIREVYAAVLNIEF